MTRAERSRLVTLVTAACLAWLVGVGALMWMTLPEIEHHGTSALKERMAAECQGSFAERYRCKEAIIVESGRESFWMVSARFLLVIVPPMAASLWLSSYLRHHPVQTTERRTVHDTDDWKTRAQRHVEIPPAGDASSPEAMPGRRPTIDDIAPIEDWKTRMRPPVGRSDNS